LAESRRWPALEVTSSTVDHDGAMEGLVAAILHDHAPLAIHDLHPPPPPPGGVWDPTAPPAPAPPPTPLWWRICFNDPSARDRAAADVAALGLDLTLAAVDLPDDDWVARSQRALTAIEAGRFLIAPPWDLPAAPPADRSVIVIDPSMGFGTGHHQTTRLCLTLLGELDVVGRSVLDIGTGSGVLAMAASLLGAGEVVAVDVDADAIEAARRSAALNVLPTSVRFGVADLFAAPLAPVDIVLANLTGAMQIKAADLLASLVVTRGHFVASGFMDYERDGVERALAGFDVIARAQEDEWCAAVLRRR
jgi:ribosomal protein L11 methyltransferase